MQSMIFEDFSNTKVTGVNLDFNSNNSIFEKIKLQSWQIIEFDWLMKCEYNKLISKILENKISLNKNFQAFLLIILIKKVTVISHKSILILMFFTFIDIWIHEIHTYFSEILHLLLYYDIIDFDKSTDSMQKNTLLISKI